MRWNVKTVPSHPAVGDKRTISKFLWRPLRIGLETRWLETVEIQQVYKRGYDNHPADWYNVGWGNGEPLGI